MQVAVTNDDVVVMLNKLDVLMCLLFAHVDRVCQVKNDGRYKCILFVYLLNIMSSGRVFIFAGLFLALATLQKLNIVKLE